MPKILKFTKQCDCGDIAESGGCLDMEQNDDHTITIDLEFMCSQMTFTCRKCGKKYLTGDIDILSEDELN